MMNERVMVPKFFFPSFTFSYSSFRVRRSIGIPKKISSFFFFFLFLVFLSCSSSLTSNDDLIRCRMTHMFDGMYDVIIYIGLVKATRTCYSLLGSNPTTSEDKKPLDTWSHKSYAFQQTFSRGYTGRRKELWLDCLDAGRAKACRGRGSEKKGLESWIETLEPTSSL